MNTISRDIVMQDLLTAMQERLWAGDKARRGSVVWQDRGAEVVVYPASLRLRMDAGWLVSALELESDQTGRETLELVFNLGKANQGDGLTATTTLEGDDPSGLRTRWAEPVQAALWDGVLDAIESVLADARRKDKKVGTRLVLAGFTGSAQALQLTLAEVAS
ncbi:MAG: hypothetical protein KC431_11565 [Myxococcales bacterium]|nr:hypothetical protein [Myxococcales bacterium]